ncbi:MULTISPECIES: hypothetical protein [Gordonibacter]|uniref:DUF3168 domain-containing protein n=1 Tax=Gordonibacter faecis TaxID=3047475 RepID=A0ABT7DPZ4_9ACTN|nr:MULTISPECIES: hypothetical protein [unclassified Gordonibacter]MDJ1651627.1 hypothetical protein [Gordonibacter sp. KGMB12511]HIW77049.1 hypothetical protein [Candidatus Gordonibacter avicola]
MDIEKRLADYLTTSVGVLAQPDVPRKRPDRFITVERTGGPLENVVIDRATVAVQCWAASRYEASALAARADAALASFSQEPGVTAVKRQSLYNFPDPTSGLARYQLVVEITTIR